MNTIVVRLFAEIPEGELQAFENSMKAIVSRHGTIRSSNSQMYWKIKEYGETLIVLDTSTECDNVMDELCSTFANSWTIRTQTTAILDVSESQPALIDALRWAEIEVQ